VVDGGCPGVEQHIYDGCGHKRAPFTTRFIWRELFNAQEAAECAADCRYLLGLSKGLWPGKNIFRAIMPVFAQRAYRDGGHVALVNRSGWNAKIRPAHYVAGSNLRSPPVQGICGKNSGSQEGPRKVRRLDQLLNMLYKGAGGIGLLEERMQRFKRSREEYDAPRMLRDLPQCRCDCRRWSGPYQENRICISETCRQSIGTCQVPIHNLGLCGQRGRVRISGHGPDLSSGSEQLRDDLPAGVPRSSDNKDAMHAEAIIRRYKEHWS
jgi:hypothetical protein